MVYLFAMIKGVNAEGQEMRRSDRQVTDIGQIIRIIEKCDVCRLALSGGDLPYIVPLNFGFEYSEGNLVLYFHSANEGRKLDMIRKNPFACFEMDTSHRIIEAEDACDFAMEYESVVGSGRISLITDKAGKINALKQLMKKYAANREFTFPDSAVGAVTVFKLDAPEFSGKRCIRA